MKGGWIWLPVAGLAAGLALLSSAVRLPPLVLWNASASVPIGLYGVQRPHRLHVGDIAVVRPPAELANYLDQRHALPRGVPLVKPIAAVGGQVVCRHGNSVRIDGSAKAVAYEHDRDGRLLPVWYGCRRLGSGEIFLMNAKRPDSLDGRYFGLLPVSAIIGRASPLWVRGTP